MSVETIPIDPDLDYQVSTVTLGGVDYRLTIAYNTRDSRWYLSIAKSDGTALISGIPVVVDTPLLMHYTDSDLPAGYLIAVDSTEVGTEPAQDDLGDRVQLTFIPTTDLS